MCQNATSYSNLFSLHRCMLMLGLRCVILMKLFSKFPFLVKLCIGLWEPCPHMSVVDVKVSCLLTILLSLDLFWHSNLFSNWVFGILELLSMCENATSSANLFSLCRITFMLGVLYNLGFQEILFLNFQ
jgi:hypothetical protein